MPADLGRFGLKTMADACSHIERRVELAAGLGLFGPAFMAPDSTTADVKVSYVSPSLDVAVVFNRRTGSYASVDLLEGLDGSLMLGGIKPLERAPEGAELEVDEMPTETEALSFRGQTMAQTFAAELERGESDVPFRRWVHVAPFGEQVLADRNKVYRFDQAGARRVIEVWEQHARHGRRAIFDWGHGSFFDGAPPESAGKSGIVLEWEIRADGLYALGEFTDRAATLIKSGDFDQVSPEIHHRIKNLDTDEWEDGPAIFAIALTARPALAGLDVLAASEGAQTTMPDTGAAGAFEMNLTENQTAILDLVGDRTPADIENALALAAIAGALEPDALAAKLVVAEAAGELSADELVEALAVRKPEDESSQEAVTLLRSELKARDERIDAMQAQLDAASAERAERGAAELVEKFERTGQVTPAMRDHCLRMAREDAAAFSAFAATLPVAVPMDELGTASSDDPSAQPDTLHTLTEKRAAEIVEAKGGTVGEHYTVAYEQVRAERPDLYRAHYDTPPVGRVTPLRAV